MDVSVMHEVVHADAPQDGGSVFVFGPAVADRIRARVVGDEGAKCLFDAALFELDRVESWGGLGRRLSESWTERLYENGVEVVRTYELVGADQ